MPSPRYRHRALALAALLLLPATPGLATGFGCYVSAVATKTPIDPNDAEGRLAGSFTPERLVEILHFPPEVAQFQRRRSQPNITPSLIKARAMSVAEEAFRQGKGPPALIGYVSEQGTPPRIPGLFGDAGLFKSTVRESSNPNDMGASTKRYFPESIGPDGQPYKEGPNKRPRFTAREWLERMLEVDWKEVVLKSRWENVVPGSRRFTVGVTAGTVPYNGKVQIGIRFEMEPGGPTTEMRFMLKLHSADTFDQQEIIAEFGAALISAAHLHAENPERLVRSLIEGTRAEELDVESMVVVGGLASLYKPEVVNDLLLSQGASKYVGETADGKPFSITEDSWGKTMHYKIGAPGATLAEPAAGTIPSGATTMRVIVLSDTSPASLAAAAAERVKAHARGETTMIVTGETALTWVQQAAQEGGELPSLVVDRLGKPKVVYVSTTSQGGKQVGFQTAPKT